MPSLKSEIRFSGRCKEEDGECCNGQLLTKKREGEEKE